MAKDKFINRTLKQRGFSLIEVLVVTTILVLVTGGAIAGYNQFNYKRKVIAVGQNFRNVLRDAQSRAFTGEKDCTVCGCTGLPNDANLQGWTINLTNSTMYGNCAPTANPTPSNFPLTPIPIPTTSNMVITAQTSVSISSFQFKTFPKGTNQSSVINICVRPTPWAGYNYQIIIDPSGNIRDYGITTSCS